MKTELFEQDAYHYDELPQGDVFRYLTLQPGTGSDPLICNLCTARLTEESFEAISYVWGSNIKDQEIICDGQVMMITNNLSRALQRIRFSDAPRRLWADSICINQSNLEEKGHQVAAMGNIYRKAKRVLICLGSDAGDHGPRVVSLLDEINQMIDETCKHIDMTWNSFPYPHKDDPILVDPRWKSLSKLLGQDWFDRGWVVREAAFAQDGRVIWGEVEFSWEHLMRAYPWLTMRASRAFYTRDMHSLSISAHSTAYKYRHKNFACTLFTEDIWYTPSLLCDLEEGRSLLLTDPRDRIYAFMELTPSSERRIDLHPDYSESYLEVYRLFAIQYIQSSGDSEILDYVSHYDRASGSSIPSWVPRWEITTSSLGIKRSSQRSSLKSRVNSICKPIVVDRDTVNVEGITMDVVDYVSDLLDMDSTTPGMISEIWDTVKLVARGNPYERKYRRNAFLDALCRGEYIGEWHQWERARAAFVLDAGLEDDQENESQSSRSETDYADGNSSLFFQSMISRASEYKFILTKRGYMGLAPAVAEVGDTCAIIFGCTFPCILRKSPREDYYTHLGATCLIGKSPFMQKDWGRLFLHVLGAEESKDWVDWDVKEQDIYLL
ncbi:heterokaryon incompatibility protein-domain-containing protein [Pyrenochaeta sp. MPI-SDFR-AT-0127]|nr:heterokaryon incompatibility protein-domain-containing protein [Pyrenochaeta sp. MPI-SDFR-AT-0127]